MTTKVFLFKRIVSPTYSKNKTIFVPQFQIAIENPRFWKTFANNAVFFRTRTESIACTQASSSASSSKIANLSAKSSFQTSKEKHRYFNMNVHR
jgi:hypothetical protein